MRRFTLGSGTDCKIVVVELDGTRMSVVQMTPDCTTKRSEKDFGSEAKARSASDQMARELISRGYAEEVARSQTGQHRGSRAEARRQGAGTRGGRAQPCVRRRRGARCHRGSRAAAARLRAEREVVC